MPRERIARARVAALASACCGLAAFALYAGTLVRGVGWDDAAELSAGIDQLGIVHQTGYPAYLLLGKALVILEPFGSVATRTSLFSAIAAAVTVWLAAAFLGRRTQDAMAAVVTGFLLATGSVFWSQARFASVYPAFLLSIVLLLTALRWWDETLQPRRLAAVAAALGLVCVSHKTGVLFLPFVGIFILNRAGRSLRDRGHMLALAAFLIPLASLLYIPARSGFEGFPNGLRDSNATVWQWITGTAWAPEAELFGAGLHGTLVNLAKVGVLGVSQLSIAALILIPVGLWFARRDSLFVWCALAPAVLISFFSATTTNSAAYAAYWHLPLILVGAVAAGYGAAAVHDALPKWSARTWIVTGALALLATTGAAEGARYAIEENLSASQWARASLSVLPRNAHVKAGWTAFTALRATQVLEGRRPDVQIHSAAYIPTSRTLRRSRYVVTIGTNWLSVSRGELQVPGGMRLQKLGPRAQANIKGVTNLEFGGVQLGVSDPSTVVYEVIASDKSGQVARRVGHGHQVRPPLRGH